MLLERHIHRFDGIDMLAPVTYRQAKLSSGWLQLSHSPFSGCRDITSVVGPPAATQRGAKSHDDNNHDLDGVHRRGRGHVEHRPPRGTPACGRCARVYPPRRPSTYSQGVIFYTAAASPDLLGFAQGLPGDQRGSTRPQLSDIVSRRLCKCVPATLTGHMLDSPGCSSSVCLPGPDTGTGPHTPARAEKGGTGWVQVVPR